MARRCSTPSEGLRRRGGRSTVVLICHLQLDKLPFILSPVLLALEFPQSLRVVDPNLLHFVCTAKVGTETTVLVLYSPSGTQFLKDLRVWEVLQSRLRMTALVGRCVLTYLKLTLTRSSY